MERILGFIPVVDRDCGPAQARVVTRHRGEHMRAYRFVGIVDRDRDLDAEIEHFAPVRPRFVRVAPHVKLLRGAADVDRDRHEREFRIERRLGGGGFPGLGRLHGVLCSGGIGLRLRVGRGGVELLPRFLDPGSGLLPPRLGPLLRLVRFVAASALSAAASSAPARALSDVSLRSDAVSDAVSRAACAAACFASSAALVASAASRASVSARASAAAMASAFGTRSAGWKIRPGLDRPAR